MAYTPISNTVPQYSKNAGGAAASDYYIKFYADGTTTPISMATDSTGGTLLAKCQLDSLGYPTTDGTVIFIPHIDQAYKLALYTNATDADNNTLASAVWVIDSLEQNATTDSVTSQLAASLDYVKNITTLAAAIADTGLADGDTLNIAERTTGNGGGGIWDVVLSSTVTENTYDIVQCTGVATLSLKLRISDKIDVRQIGAIGDGTTDSTAAIQSVMTDYDLELTFGDASEIYVLTSTLTASNKSSLKLSGVGAQFLINNAAGYTNTGAAKTTDPIMYFNNCTNLIIEGLKYDPDRAVFDAAFPSGEWGHAITLENCKDVVVKDNDIKSLRGDGIYVGYTTNNNVAIYNNYFHDNYRLGVSFVDVIGGYVRDNEIVGSDVDGVYGNGVGMEPTNAGQYCNNIVIDGNNCPSAAIGLFSRSTEEEKTNNISIINNTTNAIGIQGMNNGYVAGNKVNVELSSVSTATFAAGIKFSATSTVGNRAGCNRRCVVEGNEVFVTNSAGSPHPNPAGVYLEAMTDCLVRDNVVKTDGTVSLGVRVGSGIRLNVDSNTIEGFLAQVYVDNLLNYNDSSLVSKDDSEDISFNNNVIMGRVRFSNNNDCRVVFNGNRIVQLDNTLFGSLWLDIDNGDVTISNNIITDDSSTSYGAIYVDGNISTNVNISNNQVVSTSYGVRLAVDMQANVVANNLDAPTPVRFVSATPVARGQYLESTQSPATGAWANAGTWGAGQVIHDETGASSGWRCTVSGTPGTWVAA